MLFGLRVFYDNSNAIVLLFVLGILLLLYVLKCGLYELDVQEARIGHSQPGVGLWSPHFCFKYL